MSNIVTWSTASEVIAAIKAESAMVSGMSVSEAASALGYVKTASGLYVRTAITTTASSVVGTTASSVAVAESAATTTACNLALVESSAGTAQVVGLGSVALPVASCSLAAAGGYLLGNEIYKQNEEFLDKLMFPLYDFITGNNTTSTLYESSDVPTMPIMFDSEGNTYMNSLAYDGVKTLLDSENQKLPVNEISSDSSKYGYVGPISKIMMSPGQEVKICSFSVNWQDCYNVFKLLTGKAFMIVTYYLDQGLYPAGNVQLLSLEPFTYSWDMYAPWNTPAVRNASTIVYNGLTMYTGGSVGGIGQTKNFKMLAPVTQQPSPGTWSATNQQLYNILKAADKTISGPPTGMSTYVPGTSPSPLKVPGMPDWKPVILPKQVPGEMPLPIKFPDPEPEKKPERITPYIPTKQPQPTGVPIKKPVPGYVPSTVPVVVPNVIPSTSPQPSPKPDPSVDPSQIPGTVTPGPVTPQVPVTPPTPGNTTPTPSVNLPVIPPLSPGAGLLHVYNPTEAQIQMFGSWLWTTFSGDLLETLSKMFNNPMDAIIGLHEIYCTPITGSETHIRAGYLDSDVASRLVTNRYTEIKCGALSVPEYWGNYLDYSPYTKVNCYLPFIGIVELNSDDIIGHGVEITYKIDTYNGSCIALITTAKKGSAESVVYEFSGNCAVELPITSGMKTAIQGALIGAATAALAVGTGGTSLPAIASIGGGVAHGVTTKNTVQHSGSFGSSYGAMGIKIPYLIVKRPIQKVVPGYNENYGYPSHSMVHIMECSGYLRAIEVDVISPTATEEEKKMIEKLLKSGVYVD